MMRYITSQGAFRSSAGSESTEIDIRDGLPKPVILGVAPLYFLWPDIPVDASGLELGFMPANCRISQVLLAKLPTDGGTNATMRLFLPAYNGALAVDICAALTDITAATGNLTLDSAVVAVGPAPRPIAVTCVAGQATGTFDLEIEYRPFSSQAAW